ncbi:MULTISPECIES: alpha-amylase family glycosyl hydrolase [Bradyrhizobium]|uniref:alpha-amylase family glycosyl hydrolase n=1 Tax=Bradyrhizobium TaxID=374 RepID=UPI001CE29FD4|nr:MULTISPECIES: alpha-amylase family glycosyl hydrolase [Bradyrhizobium]MCA6104091.1 hypothetical protein [Bradyrhizobium australafricanum]MCC8969968.1 hypothetical protein [Bradyrhizobium brasilense]
MAHQLTSQLLIKRNHRTSIASIICKGGTFISQRSLALWHAARNDCLNDRRIEFGRESDCRLELRVRLHGDNADFDAFIEATCHHGLRVVLDGVFNHFGREASRFQHVVTGGPRSPEVSWFRLTWPAGGKER